MKAIVVLFVIVAAVVACVVYFGGLTSWDPQADADNFKSQVKRGMGWEQVAAIKEPKKYEAFNPDSFGGRAPAQKYNPEIIRDAIEKGSWIDGFVFAYSFSADAAYEVRFDSQGKVIDINKPMTGKDILEGKAFQQ